MFHRGAVAQLSPGLVRADVESHLTTLVRKELIRSTAPTFPEDEGYRFRHLLIRDAAYESLPKATRAELHEQFADWLSTHDLVERDEIVGYHLEQAHRYRSELDPRTSSCATRGRLACGHLGNSRSRRARPRRLQRGSLAPRRAIAIAPAGDSRSHALAPDLSFALWESGELDEAAAVLVEARASSDEVIAHRRGDASVHGRPRRRPAPSRRDVRSPSSRRARAVVEEADDDEGLGVYWWSLAGESWMRCRRWRRRSRVRSEGCALPRACGTVRPDRRPHVADPVRATSSGRRRWRGDGAGRVRSAATAGDSLLLQAGASSAIARLLVDERVRSSGRARFRSRAREMYVDAGMAVSAASVEPACELDRMAGGRPPGVGSVCCVRASTTLDDLGRARLLLDVAGSTWANACTLQDASTRSGSFAPGRGR